MKLKTHKGVVVKKIPWRGPKPSGFAAFGRIYLRNEYWQEWNSGKASPKTLSYLAHEYTHIKRMGMGLTSGVYYWLNPKFRYQEELAAIREEMKVLKKHKASFNIEKRARDLSSFAYLWCTNYKTAKEELEKAWKEV